MGNKIFDIPQWFQSFNNLEILDLRNNPVPIPPEILGTQDFEDNSEEDIGDLQAILKFYFQIQNTK